MKKLVVICALFLIVAASGSAFGQQGLTKIADNVYSYVDVIEGQQFCRQRWDHHRK